VFQIQPPKGTLEPGQKAPVRVSFYPKEKIVYSASLPLYLEGSKDKVFLELELRGEGLCICEVVM
jgi:hypothetical protein